MPYLAGNSPSFIPESGVFTRLVSAVSEHRKVTLLGNGYRCAGLAPYRLVLRDGEWYLTGEHQTRIAVFPLTDIRAVTLHNGSFAPDIAMRDILSPGFSSGFTPLSLFSIHCFVATDGGLYLRRNNHDEITYHYIAGYQHLSKCSFSG